jgi:hypothetical protein
VYRNRPPNASKILIEEPLFAYNDEFNIARTTFRSKNDFTTWARGLDSKECRCTARGSVILPKLSHRNMSEPRRRATGASLVI